MRLVEHGVMPLIASVLLIMTCSLGQVEVAGVSVTPHVATPGMKYRAGDPTEPRGALVRLFLQNAGAETVAIREALFDRQSPLSLVPNGDWSWADVPSVWTGEPVSLPAGALTVFTYNGTSGRWPAGRRVPITLELDRPSRGGRQELAAKPRPRTCG